MVTHRALDAASFGEMEVGIVGRMKTKTKTHGVRGQWMGCIPPGEAAALWRGEFHHENAYIRCNRLVTVLV